MGNIANDMIGTLEKAILVIHGSSSGEVNVDSKQVVAKARTALKIGSVSPGISGVLNQPQVLQVQYNPSSLAIQGNAESLPYIQMQQNLDAGVPNQMERPPMVSLTVDLWFDAMNPRDAFMFDKLRLSGGDLASGVSRGIQLKKGNYTVQHQTNGLLATVLRPETRLVTFAWGDLAFTGVLFEMEAEYTMFSPTGRPVRSMIRMNIAQQMDSAVDARYWDEALDKVFNENGIRKATDVSQKAGNLINLQSLKGLI